MSDNPILLEVLRGELVESRHRGAIAIADADGRFLLALGDVGRHVFPRSAVKAMQALPLIESGAADAFGFNQAEIAVACGSHSGDDIHVAAVRSILAKIGLKEAALACGAHWPMSEDAARKLARRGVQPSPIHNNCSGKHAGMLATALHLGLATRGYEQASHPIQQAIAAAIAETCGTAFERADIAIDGCSVPTFALPLSSLAAGFARLVSGKGFHPSRVAAVKRLIAACLAEPVLIAGEGRFDTIAMRGLAPLAFTKGGAEGVHCAALVPAGIGIAVKMDDGAKRGAEATLAHLLAAFIPQARSVLGAYLSGDIRNWKGRKVGQQRPALALERARAELASENAAARAG
jgi:L-asparaginase II